MLIAYTVATELIHSLRPIVETLGLADRSLADQLRRAASSVLLTIAEGERRTGRDRAHLFRVAAGSAAEVRAALEVGHAWGYLEPSSSITSSPKQGTGNGRRAISDGVRTGYMGGRVDRAHGWHLLSRGAGGRRVLEIEYTHGSAYRVHQPRRLLERVLGLLWGLTHPRR